MKVLIITPIGLPVPAVKGGAVATLIESLMVCHETHRDFELTVLSSYDAEAKKRAAERYPHTRMAFLSVPAAVTAADKAVDGALGLLRQRPRKFARKLSIIAQLKKYLLENDFDRVVFQNSGYLLNVLKDRQIAEKYRDKLYFHIHNELYDGTNAALVRQCRLMLISRYLLKKINRLCGDMTEKAFVVHNGFDTAPYAQPMSEEERAALKQRHGIAPDKKIVLYTGRLLKAKGIDALVEAFEALDRSDAALLIVGSVNFGAEETSDYEKSLLARLRALGDRAVATGFVPHEEIHRYYKLADVAVLPTIVEEGAGLTMCEAVAAGAPLITTNSGGIPEYIDFDSAVLLERGEGLAQRIAQTLADMLDNSASWQEKARRNAPVACECFSEENYYREFLEAL